VPEIGYTNSDLMKHQKERKKKERKEEKRKERRDG